MTTGHRTRWGGAAMAAACAVTTLVASAAPASADEPKDDAKRHPEVQQVAWAPCDDPSLPSFMECGMLTVPLDHDKPRGEKIQLALSRMVHTVPDDQYQGIMLVNPGGPGGSGRIFAILQQFVPNGVGEAYDWIGFDPRGVGASVPALSCDPNFFAAPRPDYEIPTKEIEKAWLKRTEAYAKACARNGGKLLDHLKTTDTVQDMDLIRKALGQDQINYYGYSYGTYLGQVYSTLFPKKVRRMVLDSNVDPTRVWYQSNLDQDVAFDTVIDLFFDWVAQHDDVYHLGTTGDAVRSAWYSVRDSLKQALNGDLGPSEWTDAFFGAGYTQPAWPDYAQLFADYVAIGDPTPILEEYNASQGVGDDNGFAIYAAVQCTDAKWPTKFSTWKADNAAVAAVAPFGTYANLWFNAPCLYWKAKPGKPVKVDGRKTPPILLLGETLDAATPFSGSLEVRRRFPSASLVSTPGGTTHANSLFGPACISEYVAAYLADGTLPPRVGGDQADAECLPDDLPQPVTAKAAAGSGGASRTGLSAVHRSLQARLG